MPPVYHKTGLTPISLSDPLSSALGHLAHFQRGPLLPSADRNFFAIFKQPSALAKIQQELNHRNKHKRSIEIKFDEKLSAVERICRLVEIDQISRPLAAQYDAEKFQNDLRDWVKQEGERSDSFMLILVEILAMLMDKGYQKKDKYPGMLIPIKAHFQSPSPYAPEENVRGWYTNKNGIHIGNQTTKEYAILKTVFHEFIHLLLTYLNGNSEPAPKEDWQKLTDLVMSDIFKYSTTTSTHRSKDSFYDEDDFKPAHKTTTSSDQYSDLIFLSGYPKEQHRQEIVSHLIQIYIENFGIPFTSDQGVLSSSTIDMVIKNITQLVKTFKEFKETLTKHTQGQIGRLELYHYLTSGNVEKFTQYVTPKNYRGFNLYPIHYCVKNAKMDLLAQFLQKGFSIDSADKFGNTPLICAIRSQLDNSVITDLVKKYHADISLKDKSGKSALDYAQEMQLNSATIELLTPAPTQTASFRF